MSPWTPGGGNANPRRNANANQGRANEAAGQETASIRTTFRAAFDHPEPDSKQLSTSLTRRLAKTSAIQAQTPIRVELQGRTAILQGVVATEHDRELAEQMIRLEAGIQAVKNEIEVGSPTSAAPMPP
jgi:osmotically-inducible protein OsmY